MQFKKLICIGLSLVMITSAAGCGASTGVSSSADNAAAEATGAEAAAQAEEDAPEAEAEATDDAQAADAAGDAAEDESAQAADETGEAAADENAQAADETGEAAGGQDAAALEEIAPEDISVTWEDSHVYDDLTLGKYHTIPTFGVKGYEDVPFIRASEYLNIIMEGKQKITRENGVMKIEANGTEAVIDPAADTITFENPGRFQYAIDGIDAPIVSRIEYNIVTPSVKHASTQTEIKPVTISLKDYHMPAIAYEDDIIMPFLALQNSFGSMLGYNVLAYNGRDYYNAFQANNFLGNAKDEDKEAITNSPYMKAIYSGPFSEKIATTQAYADYGYYSICMLLDLTFGHKEEKNITTFDEYFTRMNAKPALCSTNPSYSVTAEMMLFNYLFDSGHDALATMTTVFGELPKVSQEDAGQIADSIKESEEGKELFEQGEETMQNPEDLGTDAIIGALIEKGLKVPEVVPLMAWTMYFSKAKPEDYGDNRIDYADDTAVIYFSAFQDNSTFRSPSYYLSPITEYDEETSNFAFFYNCFEDIKQHDEVKNVVINISDNGGGAATGLISILGFLSEDGEAVFTDKDMLTGSYREEWYHVDTNLDGVADDNDGYGGQYDFYIMCSGSSYSCGNALPYFAQQNGLAKIMGTAPGGGDCVVGSFIDAYGRCAFYSSRFKIGKQDGSGFVSDEKATVPDLNMMPSIIDISNVPWYDPEGIADAVHQYQNGVTELTYDEQHEQQMSDFLESLFEGIGALSEEGGSAEQNTEEQ